MTGPHTILGIFPHPDDEAYTAAGTLALAAANAAEVEPEHRKAARGEGMVESIDDLIVHGAAELRMWVQHEGNGTVTRAVVMIARFQTAGRAVDDQFGHALIDLRGCSRVTVSTPILYRAARTGLLSTVRGTARKQTMGPGHSGAVLPTLRQGLQHGQCQSGRPKSFRSESRQCTSKLKADRRYEKAYAGERRRQGGRTA